MPMTLTHERLHELLHYEPETGVFTWRVQCGTRGKVGTVAGTRSNGYARIKIAGRVYESHRLAWLYMTGAWPPNDIDHEDRSRANNVWLNLRLATRKQNRENIGNPSNNTSGRRGVYWHTSIRKWTAAITHNGRNTYLGNFPTKELAIEFRELAEAMLYTHSSAN